MRAARVIALAAGLIALLDCTPGEHAAAAPPVYGERFWAHWGDGRAELAGYDLTYSRYGQPRRGTAVTIFVTETFSNSERVKSERPGRPPSDQFPVIKLNLVQDFPTGIYDYNLMTSVFVALEGVNGRPAGSATKVSFSAQEWCGQVYSQALFDRDGVRQTTHSYFDGEADRTASLDYPTGGQAEDALLLWARGLAGPTLAPGETREVPLLRSLERSRLGHVAVDWQAATLTHDAAPIRVEVPAGTFEAEHFRAVIGEAASDFWVERAEPRRVIKWEHGAGTSAELIASTRVAYWKMNGPGFERALKELGLTPRGPRMP